MRFPRVTMAILMLFAVASAATAQRLSQLEPGTLVRIVTRSGDQVIGPLAEVRADTVFLSSTVQRKEAALPLMNIQGYEYADGTEAGHGALGAMIGGTIAASLAMLIGGGGEQNTDGSMFLSGGFVKGAVVVIGTVLGFAAGSANDKPHWVLPTRSQGQSRLSSVDPAILVSR